VRPLSGLRSDTAGGRGGSFGIALRVLFGTDTLVDRELRLPFPFCAQVHSLNRGERSLDRRCVLRYVACAHFPVCVTAGEAGSGNVARSPWRMLISPSYESRPAQKSLVAALAIIAQY